MDCVDVLKKKEFKDDGVNKVTYLKTDQITADTYYFKQGQVLDYHRHPEGDQIFFINDGEGDFYIDNGKEEKIPVRSGMTVLAPKNVWHKLVCTSKDGLVASQVTKQPAGMEKR